MSACDVLNFKDFTSSVFECIRTTVKQEHNVDVPDTPSGKVTAENFTFVWNWNQENSTATIQCTDSPWLVPCFAINSQITSVVTGCGGVPA